MTIAKAKNQLKLIDMTLRHQDGEYRINYRGGAEATAYYTNDLEDAMDTALAMRQQQVRLTVAKARVPTLEGTVGETTIIAR